MLGFVRRAGVVLFGAVAVLALSSGAAFAHVTVNSPEATQGGYAVITFRVPTESDTASTTGLRVQMPTDTPFAEVQVEPLAGWTYVVKMVKLTTPIQTDDGPVSEAVSEVDWTATSGAIKPGEFEEFRVSAGPLPSKSSVTFKVIQHYSDNTDVSWVEVPAPGSTAEPEHPAPVLSLAPASGAAASSAPATGSPTSGATPTVTATNADYAKKSGLTTAYVIAGVGVVLGLAGCVVGFLAWRRNPS